MPGISGQHARLRPLLYTLVIALLVALGVPLSSGTPASAQEAAQPLAGQPIVGTWELKKNYSGGSWYYGDITILENGAAIHAEDIGSDITECLAKGGSAFGPIRGSGTEYVGKQTCGWINRSADAPEFTFTLSEDLQTLFVTKKIPSNFYFYLEYGLTTIDCGAGKTVLRSDVDAFITQIRNVATAEQTAYAEKNPCNPQLPTEPSLTKSATDIDAAFGLEYPPGKPNRGLEDFTKALNTPADLSFTPPVINYLDDKGRWATAFINISPIPTKFKDQFLAAVPPINSGKVSPFRRLHFNLTGMGDLDAAIRKGATLGYAPQSKNVTNWELYNVAGSARDRTTCNQWTDTPYLNIAGVGIIGVYLEVTCPVLPVDVTPAGPDGSPLP